MSKMCGPSFLIRNGLKPTGKRIKVKQSPRVPCDTGAIVKISHPNEVSSWILVKVILMGCISPFYEEHTFDGKIFMRGVIELK